MLCDNNANHSNYQLLITCVNFVLIHFFDILYIVMKMYIHSDYTCTCFFTEYLYLRYIYTQVVHVLESSVGTCTWGIYYICTQVVHVLESSVSTCTWGTYTLSCSLHWVLDLNTNTAYLPISASYTYRLLSFFTCHCTLRCLASKTIVSLTTEYLNQYLHVKWPYCVV